MRLSLAFAILASLPLQAATFRADDGVVLHYEVVGKGELVVLLSGGPGFSPEYLRPVADALASTRAAVLFHQRGTGLSAMETINAETLAMKTLVSDLEALRRELKVEKLTLVGHSWGGILSMLYASAHPDRVTALALIDSGGPTLQGVPKFAANLDARLSAEEREAVKVWSSPAKMAENRKRAILELTRAKTAAYFADRKKAAGLVASLDESSLNDAVFWAIVFQFGQTFDLRPGLKNVSVPALVLHGRQDPLESGEEVHAALAGSRLEWVEEAGHFPWLEQPERVYAALGEFLAGATKSAAAAPVECH